jgi:membrane protease YdiL (CAAX protease family)
MAAQVAGVCYLPWYVAMLSVAIVTVSELLHLNLTALQINVCYFTINCVVVWIIFHNFLLRSFRAIRFWEVVQAVILGLALHYAGTLLYGWIVSLLKLEYISFNDETIQMLAEQGMVAMVLCGVVLAPMVEETLVRGLIFGAIRRKSRVLAYIVSVLFFSAIHVWQFLLTENVWPVLLAAVQYIPAGIALGWTYEKSNNIWAPIFMHMIVNAVSFGLLSFL